MKWLLLLCAMSATRLSASSVVFWTSDSSRGGGYIEVYVDDTYKGRVTEYHTSAPSCGTAGAVTVPLTDKTSTWHARGSNGSYWSGAVEPTGQCQALVLKDTARREQSDSISSGKAERFRLFGLFSMFSSDDEEPTHPPTEEEVARQNAVKMLMLGVAVAVTSVGAIAAISNDIYLHKTESALYNGYNFGFKNRMNSHIDLEYGLSCSFAGGTIIRPPFMQSGLIGGRYGKKRAWTIDLNVVYNLRERTGWDREALFSPYVGFGLSPSYRTRRLGFGGIVGFSVGKRVKLHCRYKCLNNFQHDLLVMNQLELGLSVRYQNGLFFE